MHAAQVVGGGDEAEEPVDALETAQLDLSDGPVQLRPAEDFFDQLALALAYGEARIVALFVGEEVRPLRVGFILGDMRNGLA